MKRSRDRILTTHAGSLPRPADLLEIMQGRGDGRASDRPRREDAPDTYAARARSAVAEVVERQVEHGLDVIDDGEIGRPSFVTYVNERLSGFEPSTEPAGLPWAGSREVASFPEFYESTLRQSPISAARAARLACTGPVSYVGHAAVQADIDNLKAALEGVSVEEAFMPAISPSNVEGRHENRYYETDEAYLFAIAGAMHEEYRAIVEFASVVGRENVIAGADCGFATFAGSTEIHPTVAWAKLKSLVDGARLATRQLWGRG